MITVAIMIFGVTLFFNLARALLHSLIPPNKVRVLREFRFKPFFSN